MYPILESKVNRLASEEAFVASPTLARLLAKEGVGDGTGLASEVQLGKDPVFVLCLTILIYLLTAYRSTPEGSTRSASRLAARRSSTQPEAAVHVGSSICPIENSADRISPVFRICRHTWKRRHRVLLFRSITCQACPPLLLALLLLPHPCLRFPRIVTLPLV